MTCYKYVLTFTGNIGYACQGHVQTSPKVAGHLLNMSALCLIMDLNGYNLCEALQNMSESVRSMSEIFLKYVCTYSDAF